MKINQFNIQSYININVKQTKKNPILGLPLNQCMMKPPMNVRDKVKLTNLQGDLRMNQAFQSNTKSGISLVQTMQNSLSIGEKMGDKLKKLTVDYQNEGTSVETKKEIEKQAKELLQGISDLFKGTTFNGKKVFESPSVSIYTGKGESYKIKPPDVQSIAKIKPEGIKSGEMEAETGKTEQSAENLLTLEAELPVLQTSASVSLSSLSSPTLLSTTVATDNTVQNETLLSASVSQPSTLLRTQAISAYQQNVEMMSGVQGISSPSSTATLSETPSSNVETINQSSEPISVTNTGTPLNSKTSLTNQQTTISTVTAQTAQPMSLTSQSTTSTLSALTSGQNQKTSSQGRKELSATLNKIFDSKKEAREFFGAKNENELLELAKQETTESLVKKFTEKGYADKLDTAIKEGLFEQLGLQQPTMTSPSEPQPPVDTTEPDAGESGNTGGTEDSTDTGNTGSTGGTTGTGNAGGSSSTDDAGNTEDNIDTGNSGNPSETGNTGGTGGSAGTGDMGNSGDYTGSESAEGTGNSTSTTPPTPETSSNQWDFSNILKEDFIKKNILDVIKSAKISLEVQKEILQSRLNLKISDEGITEKQINRLTNKDTAKDVSKEIKNQLLEQVKHALDLHSLDQKRQFIVELLK